jgi:hypothetical protein
VSLGNPRLGFVCTGQTVDGHPGLEGYYLEHDRELAPHERVRFAYGETPPPADPAHAPRLDPVVWTPARLDTVVARYAMEYVRTLLPVAFELLGVEDARRLVGHAARLIGMQLYDETAARLGVSGRDAAAFAGYLAALARAQGEAIEVETGGGEARLRQRGWRLMAGVEALPGAAFDAWCELWRGALAAHDRRLTLDVSPPAGDGSVELRIGPGRPEPLR